MKYLCKIIIILILCFFLFQYVSIDETKMVTNLISFQTRQTELSASLFPVHTTHETQESLQISKKKIYIYNTHQKEGYQTGTVMDGALYLKQLLENKGYDVVFETEDFDEYKITHEMDLTVTYPTSRIFLEKNINEHGPFDLIIDFHRDALERNISYVTINEQNYAKMMMVIGGDTPYVENVKYNSQVLHQAVDEIISGVMRSDFFRSGAVYNQDYTQRMLLIEVGGQHNTYEEVMLSLQLLAKAIDTCLKENRFI